MDAGLLDSELIGVLRARGQRVTLPRLLVHRHVRGAQRHVTAEQVYAELRAGPFRDFRLGLLHGSLDEAAKDDVMQRFRRRELDLLVCTSVYEGLPNVFLQAWARGVPVVSTVDIGAPVNTLFDSVEEGAQEIEALFESRERWREASALALERYRANHSPERVLKSYGELLAGLAA